MSSMHPAARRYARAIFDLASEAGTLDATVAELRSVGETVENSAELAHVLSSPAISPAMRKSVMDAIVARLEVSPMVRNAVLLLTDRRRAALIPRIAEAVSALADESAGKVRAEVVSAAPLSAAQYARLTSTLERLTGRKIALQPRVDPTLIGGVVTRIGDKVYDGSVRSQLEEIRQSLLPS